MKFTHLMEPFRLKNITLNNRIVMAPMLSRLCDPDGIVSQKLIDYYAERARGGAGLVIVEYCYTDTKESKANQGQLGIYSDQLIAGLGDLAEAIQEWGAKAILQVCHAGRSTSSRYMGRQPIAPSPVPSYTGEMAREMTLEEIEATIESFAEAARRAKTAGFDGIELHGTHGYLMAQFLSPYTNHRTDIYGQDRGLFALQTLDRVRSKVGSEYLVGYRMAAEEFIEGGITLTETKAFAKRLEQRGIDYIHVSGGIIEVGQHFVIPMYFPKGFLLRLAEGIKQAVKVPIIAVGAIHDPFLAEEALQRKQADLIAMGRGLIADPELPNKIRSGRLEDVRTCLRCNEGCSSRIRQSKTQRCAINAEVGRERSMRIHPASRPKRVCVIGGGPAGMEAARVLALRGHRVTLIEKEKELGGLLLYATVPDFKGELRRFLQYLKTQVKKLGVEVLLERRATLELVRDLKPDSVVLAAGSAMAAPQIPGVQKSFVANALELLSGKFQPGARVVIAGGAAMGCEIAAHLGALGKKVTVVEMLGDLALDLESRSRLALLQLLKERGVETLTSWKLEKIDEGGVLLSDRNSNRREVPVDSVILALGMASNQDLIQPLRENFQEVYLIGDCLEPRKIYQAIHEGAFAGRAI
ncbi:MAG: FAD-dependent oxidoreductase [Thermodesulfobacteriota bacterium]|jgi:2,4-dienoyl-CoA reductase-like NADH-dependent reductase (Old Yellow Enzyme family)/thioredoxin reductase